MFFFNIHLGYSFYVWSFFDYHLSPGGIMDICAAYLGGSCAVSVLTELCLYMLTLQSLFITFKICSL